jgi:hypothetical protein
MLRLTPDRIKALCISADGKPHFQKDVIAALNIDQSEFGKNVYQPLKDCGVWQDDEKSKTCFKTRKRGRPACPVIISRDKIPDIVRTALSQIRVSMRKSDNAHVRLESLEIEECSTRSLREKLEIEQLDYYGKSEDTMELFRCPLFRDQAAKEYNLDCITYEGLRALIDFEFGIQEFEDSETVNPIYFSEKFGAKLKLAEKTEIERRKLEADPITMKKIKEGWAKGYRCFSPSLWGYSQDALIAQIEQMLALQEISP